MLYPFMINIESVYNSKSYLTEAKSCKDNLTHSFKKVLDELGNKNGTFSPVHPTELEKAYIIVKIVDSYSLEKLIQTPGDITNLPRYLAEGRDTSLNLRNGTKGLVKGLEDTINDLINTTESIPNKKELKLLIEVLKNPEKHYNRPYRVLIDLFRRNMSIADIYNLFFGDQKMLTKHIRTYYDPVVMMMGSDPGEIIFTNSGIKYEIDPILLTSPLVIHMVVGWLRSVIVFSGLYHLENEEDPTHMQEDELKQLIDYNTKTIVDVLKKAYYYAKVPGLAQELLFGSNKNHIFGSGMCILKIINWRKFIENNMHIIRAYRWGSVYGPVEAMSATYNYADNEFRRKYIQPKDNLQTLLHHELFRLSLAPKLKWMTDYWESGEMGGMIRTKRVIDMLKTTVEEEL